MPLWKGAGVVADNDFGGSSPMFSSAGDSSWRKCKVEHVVHFLYNQRKLFDKILSKEHVYNLKKYSSGPF